MSFNETQHPRDKTGQFAEKTGAAPEVSLGGGLIRIPRMPGAEREDPLYEGIDSFSGIDEVWKREAAAADERNDYLKRMLTTDAAAARSRALREQGLAPTTPTALEAHGFFANPFATAENDVELYHQFSMMTDEPPGDGEMSQSQVKKWYHRIYDMHDARRAELVAASVVSGKDTITE